MKANMIVPIASVQGKIAKGYYARVLNGKQIIQRCPVRHKPPTPAQLNIRKQFGERFGTARKYLHTEEKSEDNEGSGMYGVVSWWYRGRKGS